MTGLCLGVGMLAGGETITLSVDSRAGVTNQTLHVELLLDNHGRAAAYTLTPVQPGVGELALPLDRLDPGESGRLRAALSLPANLPPGRHMLPLQVRFRDAAGGRASLALAVPFDWPEPPQEQPPALLALAAQPLRLHRRGNLRVVGAARTGAPLPLRLTLVLPEEIRGPAQPLASHVFLPPPSRF